MWNISLEDHFLKRQVNGMTSLFELLRALMEKEEFKKILISDKTSLADDFNLPQAMEDHSNEVHRF
mgnify:FL=1